MSRVSDPSRRRTLSLLGGTAATMLTGCCELRGFPKPEIKTIADMPGAHGAGRRTFLAPRTVNTQGVPSNACIDVHAHFFNASDVTVKGFLEGPVAFSMPAALCKLIQLIAPLGDALAEIAPTARHEYDSLHSMAMRGTDDVSLRAALNVEKLQERRMVSLEFNRLIQSSRGKKFRDAYTDAMNPTGQSKLEARPRIRTLDDESVFKAMALAETPADEEVLRTYAASDRAPYAEGILAFIGYMLSSRYSNLLTYQSAFTEETTSIGVRRTLGLLVDFDHWLKCPPRSAHEDQMKLHAKLSQLSDSYMLPVIAYNPWSDFADHGRTLALVEEAINSGFVAVKIYPPNGFRPWGNSGLTEPQGAPSGAELDAVLQKFWRKCAELQVPVIAHAAPSMGSDAVHNELGGPPGWQALVNAPFWQGSDAPRASLGHFGGDSDKGGNDWTQGFADVMKQPRGQRVYADLAYWEYLQCATAGSENCKLAEDRLKAVLKIPLGFGQVVADRVMYGSDWLMLSKEKNWPAYAQQLHAAIRDIAAPYVEKIFSENAKNCFGARLRLV